MNPVSAADSKILTAERADRIRRDASTVGSRRAGTAGCARRQGEQANGRPSLDAETVRRAAGGEQAATHLVYESLRPFVMSGIGRFLRNRHDVEDIAQEIFIKILGNLHRFDRRRCRLTTWVFTIVRNHCFDTGRRRRLEMSSFEAGSCGERYEWEPEGSRTARPLAAVLNSELEQEIREAVGSLEHRQRRVFELREHQGLDFETIASITGVTAGTVKSRVYRARLALRRRLRAYVGEERSCETPA